MGGIVSIAAKIGCTAQTLHNWVAQAERDQSEHTSETPCGGEARAFRCPLTPPMVRSLGGLYPVEAGVHESYMTPGSTFDQLRAASEAVSTYIMRHLPKRGRKAVNATAAGPASTRLTC